MTTPWISDLLAFYEGRCHFLEYLGSFPTKIPTEYEYEREADISAIAWQLGLILQIDNRHGRRYVFVEPSPWEKRSHKPDVSRLVFGELTTEDSDGYRRKTRPELGHSPESDLPLSSFLGPWTEGEGPCECKRFGCTPWTTEKEAAA